MRLAVPIAAAALALSACERASDEGAEATTATVSEAAEASGVADPAGGVASEPPPPAR